jgi:hypothetical protein
MAIDHIRYDILAQDALRGVVRRVLMDTAKNGLPGEHHFYISFDTRAEGVRLSPRMRAQYPEEMTVVLQHQFWDLDVTENGFEVGVSFGGVPERVAVPFTAVKGFFDPSVQFGLQFEEAAEPAEEDAGHPEQSVKVASNAPPLEHKAVAPVAPTAEGDREAARTAPQTALDKSAAGGEVVQFDRFRKK